jgi:gamma-glutamyltranspeptidase/glutathione hydrolase
MMSIRTRPRHALAAAMVIMVGPLGVAAQTPADSAGMVISRSGLVISSSSIASDVGASILRKGGNAVDAAVATAFALAVTYPGAGNIGGGGFMVVRLKNGSATTIDYRERAPLASTKTMYLDSTGHINRSLTATGYLAPGVPGTVRGLALAHRRFGKLPWRDVVLPAAQLASRGFVLDSGLARSLAHEIGQAMQPYQASLAAYGKRDGSAWEPGDTLVLTDLGRTLYAIATRGADVFYTGWIADSIAADMHRNGGLITRKDLAVYQARERAPIRGRYRGYDIVTMPPPSSGGVAMVEMLNILSHFDLQGAGRWSPETLHLIIEAMRRAYVDRARYLGDPDFVQMPLKRLTSASYGAMLASQIDRTHATSSVELGKDIVTPSSIATESDETTQFSVVDKDGNAVSNTFTLEGGYGSHVVVRGAGFLLNNEMGDFNKKPGETNVQGDIGTSANVIAPGKRMLSSMTPTIVARDGRLFMVTGSPGGRTIINTVMEVVLNATGFGMNAREAVDAPRLHHQWLPDVATFERDALADSTMSRLRAMGHTVEQRGRQGDAHTIIFDPKTKTAYGANDRRSTDSKAARP